MPAACRSNDQPSTSVQAKAPPRRVARPAMPLHEVNPADHGLDRLVPPADQRWLRPATGGPEWPPRPPRGGRTGFDRSSDRNGQPDDGSPHGYEPSPFHPAWVVTALLAWATIWFLLYTSSAVWLRP